MKLYAMFKMEIPKDTPEGQAVIEHLRTYTPLCLEMRKIASSRAGRSALPSEMLEEHKKAQEILGVLLGKCFPNVVFSLEDCKWDTNDVLTRAEEASILAPLG